MRGNGNIVGPPNVGLSGVWGVDDQPSGNQYIFKQLPETEAQADANNYVCEANNPTAGGNEKGVGGGLAGADLVLVQGGAIPGAVDGWRTLTDRAAQYLQPTAALLNAFLQNPAGYSMQLKLRNINTTGATSGAVPMLCVLMDDTNKCSMTMQRVSYGYRVDGHIAGTATQSVGILPNAQLADFNAGAGVPIYLLSSVDYANGLAVSGISLRKPPKSLSDFLVYSISQPKIALTPAAGLGWTAGIYRTLLGGYGGSYVANGCDVASITFAKYPCVSLR